MKESVIKQPNQTKLSERIAYGIFFLGQGFIYSMISRYLMFYLTEEVHIATGIVTVILTASKVWDAVNDTLFGVAVDKVHFKSGNKFKPWLNITTLLLPVGTILLFSVPGSSPQSVKVIYAVAAYLLWDLLYTMCDVPIFSLVTAMTDNIRERGNIYTIAGIGGAVATALTSLFLVRIFDRFGFLYTAMLVSALGIIFMRPVVHLAKERHKGQQATQENSSLRDMWIYLKGNKYLRYFIFYRLISGSMFISVLTYFTKYCIGDVTFESTIMMVAIPFSVILYLIAPLIMKRFDKIKIYRFCMIIVILAYSVLYFVGWQNKVLMVILLVLALDAAIIPSILMSAIPADCVEYGCYKTGIRKEGITFAMQTFTNKFCSSVATAIAGLLLIVIGYENETGVMTESMQNGLFAGMCWLPVIGQLLGLPLLFKYKLRDKDVQIMADVNSGKMEKEEAEKIFAGRY